MDELAEIREQIDRIDARIARLFEERMEACGRIGRIKKEKGLQVLDEGREAEVLKSRSGYVSAQMLPYWEEVLATLMKVSKDYQWNLRENCPSRKK